VGQTKGKAPYDPPKFISDISPGIVGNRAYAILEEGGGAVPGGQGDIRGRK